MGTRTESTQSESSTQRALDKTYDKFTKIQNQLTQNKEYTVKQFKANVTARDDCGLCALHSYPGKKDTFCHDCLGRTDCGKILRWVKKINTKQPRWKQSANYLCEFAMRNLAEIEHEYECMF